MLMAKTESQTNIEKMPFARQKADNFHPCNFNALAVLNITDPV